MSEPIAYAYTNTGVYASHDGINFAITSNSHANVSAFGNCIIVSSNLVIVGNSTVFNTLNSTAWTGSANVATVTAGANTTIIFNDSNTFGGNLSFTYNKTTNTMTIGNSTVFASVNSSFFSQTANAANFIGTLAANLVVSNAMLQANLSGYVNSSSLAANLVNFGPYTYDQILVNPGLDVQQYVASASPSGNGATSFTDGWLTYKQGTGAIVPQVVADAPPGYFYSLKLTATTAQASLGSSDAAVIYTPIEGLRTVKLGFGVSTAQSVTLGFWSKTHRTGTYSGSYRNGAFTRSYIFTWTQNVADTWQWNCINFAGDTTGTWTTATTSTGSSLVFTMAAGSALVGTANSYNAANIFGATGTTNGMAATTDTFQITGAVLIPGTWTIPSAMASSFMRNQETELRLCQRYYETGGQWLFYIATVSTTATFWTTPYMVIKRAAPSMTLTGWQYYTASAPAAFTPTLNGIFTNRFEILFTTATAWQGWTNIGTWVADARIT